MLFTYAKVQVSPDFPFISIGVPGCFRITNILTRCVKILCRTVAWGILVK